MSLVQRSESSWALSRLALLAVALVLVGCRSHITKPDGDVDMPDAGVRRDARTGSGGTSDRGGAGGSMAAGGATAGIGSGGSGGGENPSPSADGAFPVSGRDTGATFMPNDTGLAMTPDTRTDGGRPVSLDLREVFASPDAKPDATNMTPPPIDMGPTCLPDCTLGTKRCGQAGGVQTCALGTDGCATWTAESACESTKPCQKAGTQATCGCPMPAGGELFVDPVAGNDSAALTPTGAESPAACRFKTLTRALAAVGGGTTRIVAKTAVTPTLFGGETFPIVVPSGVTVTTADATPTPGNYAIAFNSASAIEAISLADKAALMGFTLRNVIGNQAAKMIACRLGEVTVRSVALLGGTPTATNKQAIGIAIGAAAAVTDTCTGTFENVTVDGFAIGIEAKTSAATPVQIVDVTIRDTSTTGLLIAAGTISATNLTVTGTPGGTTVDGVSLIGVSATVAPVFNATDLAVLDVGDEGLDIQAPVGMATPQVTLTRGKIQGADGFGIRIRGGSIIATGTSVTGSGGGGMTAIDGVAILGGSATLKQMTISGSENRGVYQEAGTSIIDEGTKISGNGMVGTSSGIRFSGGSMQIGSATAVPVEISGNGLHGVYCNTAGGTGVATLSITRASIHDNAVSGMRVEFAEAGATGSVSLSGGEVFKNGLHGIWVNRAPAVSGGLVGFTADGVTVRDNGGAMADSGIGINISADVGDVTATIKNSTVKGNRGRGVSVAQGTGFTTVLSFEGNEVAGNRTTGTSAVGGVSFESASTLSTFSGNRIHNNGGDELGFAAAANGNVPWNISAAACGPTSNQIYCYGDAGSVGVRVTGAPAQVVNAANVGWSNATPTAGTFDFAAAGGNAVLATPACPPIACP